MKKNVLMVLVFHTKARAFLNRGLLLLGLLSLYDSAYSDNVLSAEGLNNAYDELKDSQNDNPKNIIFLIGDGMGVNYLSAYRYFKNSNPELMQDKTLQARGSHTRYPANVSSTIFDQYWVGASSTYPHDDTWVTDSASSATALASGVKTYNGAIGVDHQQNHLPLLFEQAKKLGMSTGLAVTSPITHATPASFFAHHKTREEQAQIADQFLQSVVSSKPLVDVAFGGGWDFFIREDKNLIEELKLAGYAYVDSISHLNFLENAPAIGLFADYGLVSAIDDKVDNLAKMTATAIRLLNKTTLVQGRAPNSLNDSEGFVLLVEGSQIDWCGHANDIGCAMSEMQSFELALFEAIDFARRDGNTLVIATADHETGGLSLGASGEYGWRSEQIYKIHASIPYITAEIIKTSLKKTAVKKVWGEYCEFELSDVELIELIRSAKSEKSASKSFKYGRGPLSNAIKRIINERTLTGWTSSGHTAADVPVLAYGPGAHLFHGFQDNTKIGKKLHDLLKP